MTKYGITSLILLIVGSVLLIASVDSGQSHPILTTIGSIIFGSGIGMYIAVQSHFNKTNK